MKTLPNITGLRFFLALLVVIYHLPQFCHHHGIPYYDELAIFHRGSQAVYVFFSLSGFLIIGQLFAEKKATGTIQIKKFFKRRMLRIFPVYFVVLFFGICYYSLLMPIMGFPPESQYPIWKGILLAVFFMPNIFAALYHPGGIIEILWSIGIEEQFYIMAAPIMLLLPSKRVIAFLLLFTVVYFVFFLTDVFEFLRTFQMYFFYFSASGLVAVINQEYSLAEKLKVLKYPLLLIALLYFFTFIFDSHTSAFQYHFLNMLLFPLLICMLVYRPLPVLNSEKMVYLGKISYGIYMYHAIFIHLAGFISLKYLIKNNLHPTAIIIFCHVFVIGMTVLAAHFSYKYYETYFLNKKQLLRRT